MQGKSIYIASVLIEKAMSAIIRVFTNEGFVVFADGRSTPVDPNEPPNDETQKLFDVSSISGPISMGIVGAAQIETADGLPVDLMRLFTNSADALRTANVVDFREYGQRLWELVKHELLAHHSGRFDAIKDGDDLLNVFVDGFMNGVAGSVRIHIFAENGGLIQEITLPAIRRQPSIHGADMLAKSMFEGDVLNAPTYSGSWGWAMNVDDVAAMACAYIHACGEAHNIEIEPFCRMIGGRIHGAVVGPTGFRWIKGFEPVDVIS